jgi:hypothetical protein
MGFYTRLLVKLAVCSICISLASSVALADSAHERTQFGHDITVRAGEEVGEATCFGCNVHVRGGHITGDVTVFGGSVVVEDEGAIAGDLAVFGGNIRLDKATQVGGDVALFGGRMHRDSEAAIRGDVSVFSGLLWLILIFGLPLLVLGAFIALVVWLVRRMTRPSVPAMAQRAA